MASRKAGFRYVAPVSGHAKEPVFTAALPARRPRGIEAPAFRDAGLEPVMAFAGLGIEMDKPDSIKKYCAELDLCADCGIHHDGGRGALVLQKVAQYPHTRPRLAQYMRHLVPPLWSRW